jgi:hypothetical protein
VKCRVVTSSAIAQLVVYLWCSRHMFHSQVSFFSFLFFFNYYVCHGCGGHQILFIFNSLHLFIFFLPLFTFENDRSAVGFSTRLKLNYCNVIPFRNVNLTNSYLILTQRFVLSFTAAESPTKFLCVIVWKIPLC